MATLSMTIGDLKGFIDLSKAMVGGLVITDFDQLFNKIEELLRTFNQMTPEIEANLALARQELKANPGLFEIGKAEFVSSVDALLANYPANTLLSDIPEFADGGGSGGNTEPEVISIGAVDIAKIQAIFADVTVKLDPVTKIVTVDGAGYSYKLPDIDRIEFSDGVLAFDIDGNAGQIVRLYQAALGREPDAEGLKYWITILDNGGVNIDAIVESFLQSNEFEERFGTEQSVSDSEFVALLYTNTLSRGYDQQGFDYWLDKLASSQTNRQDLLAYFAESAENRDRLADYFEDGIWLM